MKYISHKFINQRSIEMTFEVTSFFFFKKIKTFRATREEGSVCFYSWRWLNVTDMKMIGISTHLDNWALLYIPELEVGL